MSRKFSRRTGQTRQFRVLILGIEARTYLGPRRLLLSLALVPLGGTQTSQTSAEADRKLIGGEGAIFDNSTPSIISDLKVTSAPTRIPSAAIKLMYRPLITLNGSHEPEFPNLETIRTV